MILNPKPLCDLREKYKSHGLPTEKEDTNVNISCLGAIFVLAMTYDQKINNRSSSNTRYHAFAGLHKTRVPFTDDLG